MGWKLGPHCWKSMSDEVRYRYSIQNYFGNRDTGSTTRSKSHLLEHERMFYSTSIAKLISCTIRYLHRKNIWRLGADAILC